MNRLVLRCAAHAALALACMGACTPPPSATAGFVPRTVTVPAQPPPPEREVPLDVTTTETTPEPAPELDDAGARDAMLPVSWAKTFGHTRPFGEAIRVARGARVTFESAVASLTTADGGVPGPKQFEHASALLDQASRRFAAAFHAPDATDTDRIDALREGGAMLLAWSRRLDEAGLARAPASYRTNPAIALTFEDVANGPAKRWREEGFALVRLCSESARASRLDTPAARDCTAMHQTYSRVLVLRAGRADGGAAHPDASACACDPGDPLCSASMSGWCRPR